jgi:bifunctional aromatase (cyclase/dehydratase)
MSKQDLGLRDVVEIQQLIGKYQWLVDDGEAEEWADLYTEDGVFTGGSAGSVRGREHLQRVPRGVKMRWNGALRHQCGSLHIERGTSDDEAIARYYNFVTTWADGVPKMFTFALSELRLVRQGEAWKIKEHHTELLAAPPALGAKE